MTQKACSTVDKLNFILVRKPLAMPVVPAVVPPLSSFRNSSSRPTMEARRGGCAVREGRELWTRIAYRTRAGIARAMWCGYRSIAGRCRAARPGGRSARRPGCRPARRAVSRWWRGAPAPTTHAPASGLHPSAARATWWAGRGAGARPCRASGTRKGRGPGDARCGGLFGRPEIEFSYGCDRGGVATDELVRMPGARPRWHGDAGIKSDLDYRSPMQHRRDLGLAARTWAS